MLDQAVKEKFIELRAKGLSYDKIAKELNVSKTTLLKYAKDFRKEIGEASFIEQEAIIEQFNLVRTQRIKRLGFIIGEVDKMIDKWIEAFSLGDISLDKLLSLRLTYLDKFKEELEGVQHKEEPEKEFWQEGEKETFTYEVA